MKSLEFNRNAILLHKALTWMADNNVEITRMGAIKMMFFIWYYHGIGLKTWGRFSLGAFNNKIINWLEYFCDIQVLEHSSSLYNYVLLKRAVPFVPCGEIEFMFKNWRDVDIGDYSERVMGLMGVKKYETTARRKFSDQDAKVDPRKKEAEERAERVVEGQA